MGLYEELYAKKKSGTNLEFDKFTVEDLKTLFIDEVKTDRMIATLFDVKPSSRTVEEKTVSQLEMH